MNISSRTFFLYLSKNKALTRAAQNWGGNIAAGKIIGGTDFPSSIPFIRTLNETDVDENYKRLIKTQLLNGHYTAIATHDDKMIDYTKRLVKDYNISLDSFEFQMLYRMRTTTQQELVKEGYKTRVYVPYGSAWYGFYEKTC